MKSFQVKLLATSREQLRLHAEHLYPVAGQLVPAADEVAVACGLRRWFRRGNRSPRG